MKTIIKCGCGCGLSAKPGNKFLYGHNLKVLDKDAIRRRNLSLRHTRLIEKFRAGRKVELRPTPIQHFADVYAAQKPTVISIKKNALGYENALIKCFDVRKERRQIHGDQWKNMKDWELLALIKVKTGRLENAIINKKDDGVDSLIDLVNYSLFLLENKINGR